MVNVALAIPGDGDVQMTIVVRCCLQRDGGSLPLATRLAFAAVSTCCSALTWCGAGDCAAMADDIGPVAFALPVGVCDRAA